MESDLSEFKIEDSSDKALSRLTAFKVWLSDIKKAEYIQQENSSDYIEINGREVSRVNVIASVVDKHDAENFSSLTIDDGSAQIRLRAFSDFMSKLKGISTGDIILTIARIKSFNNETYLLPEILKKVSAKHALLRRLELILEHGKREPGNQIQHTFIQTASEQKSQKSIETTETKEAQENANEGNSLNILKDKLKIFIEKMDEGEGVEISRLTEKFEEKDKQSIYKFLEDFLSSGEAYEPRPGKIKLI